MSVRLIAPLQSWITSSTRLASLTQNPSLTAARVRLAGVFWARQISGRTSQGTSDAQGAPGPFRRVPQRVRRHSDAAMIRQGFADSQCFIQALFFQARSSLAGRALAVGARRCYPRSGRHPSARGEPEVVGSIASVVEGAHVRRGPIARAIPTAHRRAVHVDEPRRADGEWARLHRL